MKAVYCENTHHIRIRCVVKTVFQMLNLVVCKVATVLLTSEGHVCGNRFASVQNPNLKPVILDSTSLFWICLTTLSVDKIT